MQVMQRGPSFDWWLFILALLLSISGLVYVYSATWVATDPPGPGFSSVFQNQALYLLAALTVFFIVRRINWGLKPDSWLWFYLPVVFLLLALLFIGNDLETGAVRWIKLGGRFTIQPSEFAKLGLTLILAWLYSGDVHLVRKRFWLGLAIMLSMLALVVIQPDLGTSLVFLIIFFVMGLFAAVPRRWLVLLLLCIVGISMLAWTVRIPLKSDKDGNARFIGLRDYQKTRITAFINPYADPTGSGYHIIQSENAIGAGGLTGQGFLRGTQVHGGFIPVLMSDFIFAVVGEEFGFIGCVWLLLLYFLLLARILALSRDALSLYERYICYGASAVIFFHVFIAVGMTIRLAPITGLPLPFVSYGGSALMTMWLLMAILQSIYTNSRRDFRTARPRN